MCSMKYSSLLNQSNVVYKAIQQEIEEKATELADEVKWIEWAFVLLIQAWERIEKRANDYSFLNHQDEICFYKTLKPRFTGLIDYFTLLYTSLLFQPDDYLQQKAYWKSELDSCRKSISKYET